MVTEKHRGVIEGTTEKGFTCYACGRYFAYADEWSETQAAAEMRQRFGSFRTQDPAELAAVCDRCYKNPAMPWNAMLN